MTFFRALNITAWKTMPDFIDPSINTTLDCSRLPTLTFKTMCTQINSLGAPPTYGIYSMQNMSVDSNERIHWDIITTRLEALNNKSVVLNLEAFHLDVGAELYNSQIDIGKATRALNSSSLSLTQFSGRETFEATYFVPMKEVSLYDHAWINWGFSQEDIGNMTKFLIGGTLLNSGVLMMQSPELLANISDIAVILLVGTSVVIAVLGWFVSRGVDSTVRDPITEVLPKVLDYKQRRKPKETTFPSLRYLRVANLTLVPAQISDPPALSCSPKATTDLSSSITIDSDTGPSSSITIIAESPLPPSIKDANYGHDCSSAAKSSKADILVLRMDIDGDDEQIEVINVLETTEQDRSRTLSNTLGQSQTNSAVALLPLARQQSSASLRLS
ncbi:hypothetical protein BGZ73_001306 [Actinomortierella ambigua]|nr:hypothetical protein BGZ73_001306 [Actinomortierella ambigua]